MHPKEVKKGNPDSTPFVCIHISDLPNFDFLCMSYIWFWLPHDTQVFGPNITHGQGSSSFYKYNKRQLFVLTFQYTNWNIETVTLCKGKSINRDVMAETLTILVRHTCIWFIIPSKSYHHHHHESSFNPGLSPSTGVAGFTSLIPYP